MSSGETTRALRWFSYVLFLCGAVQFLPLPVAFGLRLHFKANPDQSFQPTFLPVLLITGIMLIWLPAITIPFSALWVRMKTGSRESQLEVLKAGFLSYAPAFVMTVLVALVSGKYGNVYAPSIFGVLLMGYALNLKRRFERDG